MDFGDLTWVLQSNAIGAHDYATLSECINERGIRLETLKVIPFSHEPAEPLPDISGPCVVYGSSGLLKVAHEAAWAPAGWDGKEFEADIVHRSLGPIALNHGATRTVWSEVVNVARSNDWTTVFVRPNSETKKFPGKTYDIDDLEAWIKKLTETGCFDGDENDAVVGPALSLGREWRVFVVNGEQVSMCQYARNGILDQASGGPRKVTDFVTNALQIYRPAPCFVVDVAEVMIDAELRYRVVEFNSINSAGFYLCDIDKVVAQLSQFVA